LAGLKKLPDIILSEYSMPRFSGLRAAELVRESGLDIPFILVSGTVGEEAAVDAMKHGATDYLLKDRMARLGNAVKCALEQKRLRAERRQTAEELRWKTALLEAQLDASIDGILVVDNQGKKILHNRRLEELWKIPRHIAENKEDAVQVQFVSSRTKNPRQFAEKVAYLYSHPDEVSRDEIELIDGAILDRYSSPVRDQSGTYFGRIWSFRDITERKRVEDELHWRTAFFEALVDSTLDGILVLDSAGKKVMQNAQFNRLFKIAEDAISDMDELEMMRRFAKRVKKAHQFAGQAAHVLSHPDDIGHNEIEMADGAVFERYHAPVRDKAGKHYGRIWTFRDITERRKLEAQFRQAQKLEGIGQLAGGVAHDFNNLLATIQMNADLLRMDDNITPAQLEHAIEIGEVAQHAAALTRQLLLFSRKETLQLRDLDLTQSINEMTKMLRRTLGEEIQLQYKFAVQSLFLHADAGMLDQVLLNLAVNARDAMPNGGQLIIETSAVEFDEAKAAQVPPARAGSFVCLSVSDTGCGIPPEVLPRIFEPFFTTKGVGKGTGLGLATVFGIVQQHQGWINVYSEVGRGTTFRIYLPRLATLSAQEPEELVMANLPGGNETILFVEDDSYLHAAVFKTLSQLGYRVLAATNGIEALEIWKQHCAEIRLLLTDLVMPGGMTGKDLGQRLLHEEPKLKLIYTSGYSADLVGKDFRVRERVDFLSKPFDAHQLAQTIRNCLDQSSS
jgi:nitrogen-specific signal transduction histidine kinase/FixJ family two-component response regulator